MAPDTPAHPPLVWNLENSRVLMFSAAYVQSRMDVRDPDALQLEYTRIMMGFLLSLPAPRSIAMIGLGGGSLPKFCHRYLPHTRITVIEIDAAVIALRDTFAVPPDGPRFFVHHADAAQFLRHCESEFDVILADGFDTAGLPPALSTEQFYCDCRNALTPSGLLVSNLHAGNAVYGTALARIERVFDGAVSVVAGTRGLNRVAFAAADGPASLRRLCELRCPSGFDPAAWKTLVPGLSRVVLETRSMLQDT
ncbi:MAG: fused MFS/spermidine synthase [Rhodoferax sp.]